ncbi:little elongation complex subunit 2 [Heterodontus francisci]|uniref:little elongation complex subunit 2 n=1 Tax=Heterodontus francisci TaxID=7792 RepID=UPI00355C5A9E
MRPSLTTYASKNNARYLTKSVSNTVTRKQTVENSETPTPAEPQQTPNPSTQPECSAPANQMSKGSAASFPLPEPRVPYPRFSSLSERDQRNYVQFMEKYKNVQRTGQISGKMFGYLAQYSTLKNAVWNEIPDFMKYLQNVARICAEDYNVICPDALRYTEELLVAWNESVKKYPELYTVSEITSIMGGKFIPDLTFQLEKKLLCLGRALFLRVPTSASSNQLTTDYKSMAAFTPPTVKASAFHSEISSDVNAEKLSAKYGAKVSLTSQALFALLNNCGPNYTEPWEIPVHVKTICGEGNQTVKVVFIDSPLAKKNLTVREKNLLFYEVPLDLLVSKKYYTAVSSMTLDKPERSDMWEEHAPYFFEHQRSISTYESSDFKLDTDFSELETFGSISSGLANQKSGTACKRASMTSTPLPTPVTVDDKNKNAAEEKSDALEITQKIMQEKRRYFVQSQLSLSEESNTVEFVDCEEKYKSDQQKTDAKKEKSEGGSDTLPGTDSDEVALFKGLESEKDGSFSDSDSDGERLVIDTSYMESHVKTVPCDSISTPEKLGFQGPKAIIPDTPRSPSPDQDAPSRKIQKTTGPMRKRKASKPLSKEFDPVGEIMRMQCKLLKPSPKRLVDQPQITQEPNSLHVNPAYSQLSPDRNPTTIHGSAAFGNVPGSSYKAVPHMRTHLLSEELLNCNEAESDYTAPPTGNVTYKLFSLSDLLLLVRGHVHKAQIRPRSNKGVTKKHVPIYVLPKLEYQSAYGIEAFTESEICRLWTESLLNSNAWFYIGHIDVFTSKLISIDQFPAISIAEKFGSFKPVNSLNILRHVLKKVSSLPEGRYLLSHSSGDSSITIHRSSQGGKFTRAAYNLHAAHSTLPPVPSSLSVPWVPLDPNILLPYHIHHGRAPCTFPPRSSDNLQDQKIGKAKANRGIPAQGKAVTMETRSHPPPAQQNGNAGIVPKKKKNKGKRAKRQKWWRAKKKLKKAQCIQGQ